uniref:Terpene synthase metal-binding domain-containing protein n=1 Tax=Physcomitrium patens TaxID=3218 RepID=A0A7I4FD36_PHYPA
MPAVTNKVFLKLAKADFNMCQALQKKELERVIKWNASCHFKDLDFARQKSVECYFAGPAVRTWNPKLINGLPDQAKILFMGLYKTVNTIAEEAFVAQKRDVHHHFKHYVSLSAYTSLQYKRVCFVPLSIEQALFFVGQRLDEDVLDSYDYHNVMHLVNRIGRILNDIQGRKREANQGKKLCVQMYMEEHPCVPSEAMAIAHLQELVDNSMQQLTYEVLRFIAVPKSCKRIHLNMAKIMHAFYKDTDRFSSLTAMAGFVKKVLFEPVPE